MSKKIVALVGTYRKERIIDQAVDAVLSSAASSGAQTKKIHLIDKHVEFCTNCRACTQTPGERRGICPLKDDMNDILNEIEQADALVLASPVNFYNVTAITRRFMERLMGYAYWPWGSERGPQIRVKGTNKKAVLISASGMPGFLIPFLTGATRALSITAEVLGAKPIGKLLIGLACKDEKQALSEGTVRKAHNLGKKLCE